MPAVSNVLLWPVRAIGAYLPDGWGGLARQLAIFIPFDIAYELSRRFATGGKETALQHARDVVHAEQSLGIYQELAVQRWALDAPGFVMEVAKFTYFQCQFTITFGFVLWVYAAQALRLHAAAQRPLRDVHARAARLHPLPDGAAAAAARRGLRRSAARRRRSTRAASSSRSSATPTRPCRACTRRTAILVGATGVLVTRHLLVRAHLGALSRARRLLDRGHGQPLLPRRDRRRGRPGASR